MNRNTATGELRRVEMNDINGSANFGNMSDYCLCVSRDDAKQLVTVYIDKVRFKHLGSGYTHAKLSTTASTDATGLARKILCMDRTATSRDR